MSAGNQKVSAQKISTTNEFVIKFANVNGSGSASANQLFAKSIFRSGVPVAPRNIFPSNIQGLPTWFEVRVSEAGYLGRRGGVDIMVAVNSHTFDDDVRELDAGGYLIYDNTGHRSVDRTDISVIGIPMTRLCLQEFGDLPNRQLFKNMVYVGALAALLDIDVDIISTLVSEQFKGKDKLIAPNMKAIQLGLAYAREHFDCPLSINVRKSDQIGDRIMIEGNAAAALGCVYGGATVAAWYPITPSTSVAEGFERYCKQLRIDPETNEQKFAIVQAEDELAAAGIAIGAAWNGARAFTATSGPGISLMSEFLGLAYFSEVPFVLFDIERGGPSTGMPTRTQQSDLLAGAYASHGDTKHVLLFPANPKECFDFGAQAFDLADRLQTPIMVMSDLDIGMNNWVTDPFDWNDNRQYDRGKVLDHQGLEQAKDFGRYLDVDGDHIPYRTYPGAHPTKGAYFNRGSSHDPYARYTEKGDAYVDNMERLRAKIDSAVKWLPEPEIKHCDTTSRFGVVYFGSTAPALDEAVDHLLHEDIDVDTLRIRGFPFHKSVASFLEDHDKIFVVEQNRDGQMRTLLINETSADPDKLVSIVHYDGTPITAHFIARELMKRTGPRSVVPLPTGPRPRKAS